MKKENKNKIQPRQQVVIQILWSILQNEKLTDMGRQWGRQQEAARGRGGSRGKQRMLQQQQAQKFM